jgi:hypothetical protein
MSHQTQNYHEEPYEIEDFCLKCRKPIWTGESRQRITREIVFCEDHMMFVVQL